MKKFWITLAAVLAMGITQLSAQSPVPEPDSIPDPVKQGDPAADNIPPDLHYIKDVKRIMPDELPAPVRHTLESSPQYSGWEKSPIYKSRSTSYYIVELRAAGSTTKYTFDKNGKPVAGNDRE